MSRHGKMLAMVATSVGVAQQGGRARILTHDASNVHGRIRDYVTAQRIAAERTGDDWRIGGGVVEVRA